MFSYSDKQILLELAREVSNIASDPINDEKRKLWCKHNSLNGDKPVIFIHPDNAWNELIKQNSLMCHDSYARSIEYELKKRVVRYNYINDDVPIEKTLIIPKTAITINEGWGIVPEKIHSSSSNGAWKYKPLIKEVSDWKKLKKPSLDINERLTSDRFTQTQDLLDEHLDVSMCGIRYFSFHMMHLYCDLRGLEQMMMDLVINPNMVHDIMSFFTEGFQGLIDECVENNLISLNNNDTFHYTGGVGYTEELPQIDYDKNRIRLKDVWASCEAQEFAQVSPQMHEEFVLQYERRLLEPFGLNGYGCCEDLTKKLDGVLKINNIRRISICPWADIKACADRLGKEYIMSWKPHPAYFSSEIFDEKFIEKYLEEELKKAKHGYLELILRDTHTCFNEPQRFNEFVKIARRVIERIFG